MNFIAFQLKRIYWRIKSAVLELKWWIQNRLDGKKRKSLNCPHDVMKRTVKYRWVLDNSIEMNGWWRDTKEYCTDCGHDSFKTEWVTSDINYKPEE